jgi:Cu2+-exporting ATPase
MKLLRKPQPSRTIIPPSKSGNRLVAIRKSEAVEASLFFYNEIMEHHEHMDPMNMTPSGPQHRHEGHSGMIEDFRRRFWISLIITLPILALSPLVQQFLHLGNSLRFGGDSYVLWALSSAVYFYGGYPFLKGIYTELKSRQPGMMTLIAVAITTAWVYSSAVVFGLPGDVFSGNWLPS